MATVSDVETALAALVGSVLYPTGSPPSILAYPIRIYAGWPDPAELDADMTENPAGSGKPTKAHVSIYPLPSERNTTRGLNGATTVSPLNPATYTLSQSGQQVTVGGVAPTTSYIQNLAVFINGKPYLAQSTGTQTATQLATALQSAIVADVPGTTLSGAVITLPASARIGALRIGTEATANKRVKTQERQFQISTWSSNPASRAAIADSFDPVLADAQFLTFADGTLGRLTYHGSREDDFTQKQRIYRRSAIWLVEFDTVRTSTVPQIVVMETERSVTDAAGNVLAGPVNTFS